MCRFEGWGGEFGWAEGVVSGVRLRCLDRLLGGRRGLVVLLFPRGGMLVRKEGFGVAGIGNLGLGLLGA